MIQEQNKRQRPKVPRQMISELEERVWDNLEGLSTADNFHHRVILVLFFHFGQRGLTVEGVMQLLKEGLSEANPDEHMNKSDQSLIEKIFRELTEWRQPLLHLYSHQLYFLTIEGQATAALMDQLSNNNRPSH